MYSILFRLLLFMGLIYADESWKVYDDSQIAIINITLDQDDLEWMYDWENVESDSLHPASIHFQNAYIILPGWLQRNLSRWILTISYRDVTFLVFRN